MEFYENNKELNEAEKLFYSHQDTFTAGWAEGIKFALKNVILHQTNAGTLAFSLGDDAYAMEYDIMWSVFDSYYTQKTEDINGQN